MDAKHDAEKRKREAEENEAAKKTKVDEAI